MKQASVVKVGFVTLLGQTSYTFQYSPQGALRLACEWLIDVRWSQTR